MGRPSPDRILDGLSGIRPLCELGVLVVAAHPDDEVIGAAGRLMALGERVRLLHVTDGSPRNGLDARRNGFRTATQYARARRAELDAALDAARLARLRRWTFPIRDQEASFALASLTSRISAAIARCRPDVVLTHPFEGGHPDHDAAAFAVQTACDQLAATSARPVRAEFASYHARDGQMRTGEFLPATTRVVTVSLSERERRIKRAMVAAFRSQREALKPFDITHERFRVAPVYDFSRPPHEGALLYEWYPWGITGQEWLAQSLAARDALGVPP